MATITETKPAYSKLQLRTAYGPVYRDVLTTPPRPATADEIPVIDFSDLYGDYEARKRLAQEIKQAATKNGFFYAKNHGIKQNVIERAENQAYAFFRQSTEAKETISTAKSRYFNGWSAPKTTHASAGESKGLPLILMSLETTALTTFRYQRELCVALRRKVRSREERPRRHPSTSGSTFARRRVRLGWNIATTRF